MLRSYGNCGVALCILWCSIVYLWDVLVELSTLVAATSFLPGGKKVVIRKVIQLVIAYFNIVIVENIENV